MGRLASEDGQLHVARLGVLAVLDAGGVHVDMATVVDKLVANGQLAFLAGRIEEVHVVGEEAIVSWAPRGTNERREMRVQRIVNCTGPAGNLAEGQSPLLRDLLARGYARPDACALGLDVDEYCRLIGSNGGSADRLMAVGPLSRGSFWEITSVPDIRVQAAQVARNLARVGRGEADVCR